MQYRARNEMGQTPNGQFLEWCQDHRRHFGWHVAGWAGWEVSLGAGWWVAGGFEVVVGN